MSGRQNVAAETADDGWTADDFFPKVKREDPAHSEFKYSCGQSYKASTLVNYNSRVVSISNL